MRADSVITLVGNLKVALEESTIRSVIEKDKLALKHVNALGTPLKDVERTLDEVAAKLAKQYRNSIGSRPKGSNTRSDGSTIILPVTGSSCRQD